MHSPSEGVSGSENVVKAEADACVTYKRVLSVVHEAIERHRQRGVVRVTPAHVKIWAHLEARDMTQRSVADLHGKSVERVRQVWLMVGRRIQRPAVAREIRKVFEDDLPWEQRAEDVVSDRLSRCDSIVSSEWFDLTRKWRVRIKIIGARQWTGDPSPTTSKWD